jgi:hypothetical protein
MKLDKGWFSIAFRLRLNKIRQNNGVFLHLSATYRKNPVRGYVWEEICFSLLGLDLMNFVNDDPDSVGISLDSHSES